MLQAQYYFEVSLAMFVVEAILKMSIFAFLVYWRHPHGSLYDSPCPHRKVAAVVLLAEGTIV